MPCEHKFVQPIHKVEVWRRHAIKFYVVEECNVVVLGVNAQVGCKQVLVDSILSLPSEYGGDFVNFSATCIL